MPVSTTDSVAESYDKVSVMQQKGFLKLVASLKIESGFKCLDIGCGTGSNTAWLAKKVGKDGHVLGIDPDEKRIKVASEKCKDISNLDFVVGRSVDIPLCNEGYDFIVSNYVMHWVDYYGTIETYRKAFNAIKPGGIIAIHVSSGLTQMQKAFLSNGTDESRDLIRKIMSKPFKSLEDNRKIFTEIGFKIVETEEFGLEAYFESIDCYCEWFDATWHGSLNGKEIYEQNRTTFDTLLNDDGSITDYFPSNKIVATKNV